MLQDEKGSTKTFCVPMLNRGARCQQKTASRSILTQHMHDDFSSYEIYRMCVQK